MQKGKQQAVKARGGISRLSLILAIILALALAASIAANVYASGQTDIFWKDDYGVSLQNSRIYVDEELGITFLGMYSNVVKAFDREKNELWSNDIGGAVAAMAYDSERDWLVVGSQDRSVYVYQASVGAVVNTFVLTGRVYDLA